MTNSKFLRIVILLVTAILCWSFDHLFVNKTNNFTHPNLITEGILTLITAIIFISLGRLGVKPFFRYLDYGFYLLFISFLTDTLDQLYIHGKIQTTIMEKMVLILGYILIYFGIRKWFDDFSNLTQSLKLQANTDELTGLLNRRGLIDTLTNTLSLKTVQPIAILIGDLDQFKKINDNYGHLVGDKVLKKVAAEISSLLESQQYIGRWGGEEFAIISPQTESEEAFLLAEKIRARLENMDCKHLGLKETITISFGLSQIEDSVENIYDAIKRADKALYQSKNNGRNQTTFAT